MSQLRRKGNKIVKYVNNIGFATHVTIPEGIVTLGEKTFYGEDTLRTITLPSTLLSIGRACFTQCTGLQEINFPENLKSIGDAAFWGCENLKKVYLPEHLTYIGKWAFARCDSLTDFEVHEDNPCFCFDDGILLDKEMKTIIMVPKSKYDLTGELVIPSGITAIRNNAFADCSQVKCITLPDEITHVTGDAFPMAFCPVRWKDITIPILSQKNDTFRFRIYKPSYMKYVFRFISKKDFILFDHYEHVFPIIQKLYQDVPELNASQISEVTNSLIKLTDENDITMIEKFLDMKIFVTAENIDILIHHAIETKHYDIQLLLMEYKRNHIGYREITDILKL